MLVNIKAHCDVFGFSPAVFEKFWRCMTDIFREEALCSFYCRSIFTTIKNGSGQNVAAQKKFQSKYTQAAGVEAVPQREDAVKVQGSTSTVLEKRT